MRQKEIVTPEGVPLRFQVASAGDRFGAFLFDAFLLFLVTLAFGLLLTLAPGRPWLVAASSVFFGFSRILYFTWFELRWQGSTPGKRRRRLRVIDARGGPLRAEAVIVRNLAREFEVLLPLALVFAAQRFWPGAPDWARAAAGGWALLFALLPLFNRHRLRAGDLAAGTVVVVAPRAPLLEDQGQEAEARFAFTDAQLDVYGIYELQLLEDVLRRRREAGEIEAAAAVCAAIRKKIGFAEPVRDADVERFLADFYAALRSRLERRMLLGRRKADKHAR